MNPKEQLRQEWSERIAAFRASGQTMKAWCAENHVTIDRLKYWLYKSKPTTGLSQSPSTPSLPCWVPLAVADAHASTVSSLVIRIGSAGIEVSKGFDPELLREVVHALGGAPC